MKRNKRVVKKEIIENEQKVDNNYKCSECQNSFNSEKEANVHILKEHYGLARINDENNTPFTENEIIKALIKAQKVVKVLKCKNTGCNKSFKSGLGLKMHLDLCGKSENELMRNCEICGKQLRISSIVSHMKIHDEQNKKSIDSQSNQVSTNDTNVNKSKKRASAIRASKSFKKITKGEVIISGNVSDSEMLSDSEHESEPKSPVICETTSVMTKMSVEQGLKKVLEIWKDSITSSKNYLRPIPTDHNWSNEISVNGKVSCPLEGCSLEFSTRAGLDYHYRRCGIEIKFSWRCNLCGFEAQRGNKAIVFHLWTSHKSSLPSISPELTEIIFASDNYFPSLNSTVKKKLNLIGTINHVLEFHERYYREKAFNQWVPTIYSWTTLDEKDNSVYIPNSNPSAFFKSTSSKSDTWQRLNLFDSISTADHVTFFVGGPVWSSAWCPLPVNVNNFDQFLAISSSMNFETTHTLNDTEMESGLIQIWNMGKLEKIFDATIKPRLALCIAHSYGMIWDMEWCPGGTAWEDMNGFKDIDLEILPRLGLLAIACGDGYIRIHSIPHPETLQHSYQNSLYYNEPVVILNPPGVANSTNYETTICKCLSWIKSNNQHLIAGGFGSGLIAVWDLTTTSTLLIIERNNNQIILRPLQSWIGHSASVNRIKWINNSSKQFIVSCSFDRSVKLWNLKDLTIPVTTIKKGLLTAIDVHLQWCGVFLANDDCYLGFQNNVIFKDFGFVDFHSNSLTSHKSCVWDLSFSEWVSAAVSVDAAGEAVIYPNFQFKPDLKPKRRPLDRIPLYHISPFPLTENKEKTSKTKNCNNENQNKANLIIDPKEPPLRSYSHFISKYGLVFNDYSLTNFKLIPMEEFGRIRLPTQMQYQRLSDYPLISLNKVCWNPNFCSCNWILTATQSGLCRISCLPTLNPIAAQTPIS